jgi:hypothetical protein
MAILRNIGKVFAFVAVGIVTIIVGAFMLRGTMHMWDKDDSKKDK